LPRMHARAFAAPQNARKAPGMRQEASARGFSAIMRGSPSLVRATGGTRGSGTRSAGHLHAHLPFRSTQRIASQHQTAPIPQRQVPAMPSGSAIAPKTELLADSIAAVSRQQQVRRTKMVTKARAAERFILSRITMRTHSGRGSCSSSGIRSTFRRLTLHSAARPRQVAVRLVFQLLSPTRTLLLSLWKSRSWTANGSGFTSAWQSA